MNKFRLVLSIEGEDKDHNTSVELTGSAGMIHAVLLDVAEAYLPLAKKVLGKNLPIHHTPSFGSD